MLAFIENIFLLLLLYYIGKREKSYTLKTRVSLKVHF